MTYNMCTQRTTELKTKTDYGFPSHIFKDSVDTARGHGLIRWWQTRFFALAAEAGLSTGRICSPRCQGFVLTHLFLDFDRVLFMVYNSQRIYRVDDALPITLWKQLVQQKHLLSAAGLAWEVAGSCLVFQLDTTWSGRSNWSA